MAIVPEKISVVYAGCDHICHVNPDYSVMDKLDLPGRRYILAASSINPRKNFKLIINSMNELIDEDITLVIVGGVNPRVFGESRADFPENVKYAGYISDQELKALYMHALCFVYPSIYEGFGLPPLEAMACGCPVVVSNRTSLPEVCGDAAVYIDPYSVGSLLLAIKKLSYDTGFRDDMIKKGFERAKFFSWKNTADKVLAVCRNAMS